MNKFYAILINFVGSVKPLTRQVETALEAIPADWLRLAPGQYIVHTNADTQSVFQSVKRIVHSEDLVLVVEVNLTNRHGWVQQVAIDWISKKAP